MAGRSMTEYERATLRRVATAGLTHDPAASLTGHDLTAERTMLNSLWQRDLIDRTMTGAWLVTEAGRALIRCHATKDGRRCGRVEEHDGYHRVTDGADIFEWR